MPVVGFFSRLSSCEEMVRALEAQKEDTMGEMTKAETDEPKMNLGKAGAEVGDAINFDANVGDEKGDEEVQSKRTPVKETSRGSGDTPVGKMFPLAKQVTHC